MFKTIPTLSQQEEEEAVTRTPIDTDGDGNIDRIEFDRDNNGNTEQSPTYFEAVSCLRYSMTACRSLALLMPIKAIVVPLT